MMIEKKSALAFTAVLLFVTVAGWAQTADIFEKPIRLKAAGEFINVDRGHSTPFIHDFNNDGKLDLLVGQFGEGKLRIYLNTGTNKHPVYETQRWFKTEGEFGTVPSG
jgi:hypothetical protein